MDSGLEKKFNFGTVVPDKLYRSSQPNGEFLEYLQRHYSIKTVIVLRTHIDDGEKEFCQKNNIQLVQLPMKSWRRWPEVEEVKWYLDLLEDFDSGPILIHCWRGKDRTGAMIALYRLGRQKWHLKEALEEMKLWQANWFWRLYIQTSASKVLAGFKEKNIFLLYLKRFLNLIFAFEGLVYAFRYEKNLKMFLALQALLIGVAIWQGATFVETGILLLGFGIFNALEIFNSAIERLSDLIQSKFDPRVKVIKDLLAAAVTFAGFAVFIFWVILVFF
ncbi:MAG: diacylglycerol kinase [Candidatus Nealsonbacteria bacterium]|nr:diacylglycerol kinase [Candidatus Nealsonbacteria bacterium]